IRDIGVTGVQTCALPILKANRRGRCDRSGEWFDPTKVDYDILIAYKGADYLTAQEKDHFFGSKQAWPLTVVLDRTVQVEEEPEWEEPEFAPEQVDQVS